jgi:hypothetical protein
MNLSLTQIVAAIVMTGIAVVLFYAYRRYLAANSERRMREMLHSVGLDPEIAAGGNTQVIMKEVRQRCRSCSTEDVCERWLAGDEKGENDFCPNSRVFETLKKYGGAAR